MDNLAQLVRITVYVNGRKRFLPTKQNSGALLLKNLTEQIPVICAECNSLLNDIFMASSKHHEAVSRLAALAGGRESHLFRQVLNHCRTRARHYRHVLNALRVHQVGYGCLKNIGLETSIC